jgi:predicted alpha/beta-hydrolase family hydrolase
MGFANWASFRKKILQDAMTLKFPQEKTCKKMLTASARREYSTHVILPIEHRFFAMPPNAIHEPFVDTSLDPHVRGFLHQAAPPSGGGLILTHGAGSNSKASLLVALAEAFAGVGVTVLRCDLPYRQNRPYGPPRPGDAARDREGLKNAVTALRKLVPGRMFLGGHSYGGRQATMLCADQPGLVEGLLLLSYPLHPPRKPDQLRIQHLPKLQTAALFVHGTRDPFGSPQEIESALTLIPAKTWLLRIEGAGHDLGFKGKAKPEELPVLVLAEFQKFFS